MKQLFTIFLLFLASLLHGQYLTGMATKWSDVFTEWTLFTDTEGEEGEMKVRWALRNDWSEWDYSLGEDYGRIKLKFGNNFNEWEVRGGNQIVTVRTLWNNNFREWRIRGGGIQLTLKCRYGNTFDEWEIRDSDYGIFQMYTNWEGDPRNWVIVDELDERVSFHLKMAMVFVVTYHSFPKG